MLWLHGPKVLFTGGRGRWRFCRAAPARPQPEYFRPARPGPRSALRATRPPVTARGLLTSSNTSLLRANEIFLQFWAAFQRKVKFLLTFFNFVSYNFLLNRTSFMDRQAQSWYFTKNVSASIYDIHIFHILLNLDRLPHQEGVWPNGLHAKHTPL
jgi:hypothetical protein